MINIEEPIKKTDLNGCIFRDGFVFSSISEPVNVLDAIVIRNPNNSTAWSPRFSFSEKSLEEHIAAINCYSLERAIIIGEDIGFISQCPTLKYLRIIPADTASADFDYSPLYTLPELRYLHCDTDYGGNSQHLHAEIDYKGFATLKHLQADGAGHKGYAELGELETLWINNDKKRLNLEDFTSDSSLSKLWLMSCGLETLHGVESLKKLQNFCVCACKKLESIGDLEATAVSLQRLSIENCPRITDFSVLYSLYNLTHLSLEGSNKLPSLDFLKSMPKLQMFIFSMAVESGDISPCLDVPYVDMLKGHKEYNLKNRELPKKVIEMTP